MPLIQALTTLALLHVRNAIHKLVYFVISYSYFKQHRTCGAVCFDALILKIPIYYLTYKNTVSNPQQQ